jgi:hypothetical protein
MKLGQLFPISQDKPKAIPAQKANSVAGSANSVG